MAGKKWNNQGGSNFGNQNNQNRIQKARSLPSVPQFDDLRESEVTSFKLMKARSTKPEYGEFGDAIWINEIFAEDEYIDIIPELDDDDNLDIPPIRTKNPPELTPYYQDKTDPENNPNLFPDFVYEEYEIVVKYAGGLVLTIMSGQAYAARNALNDARFDLAVIIISSAPIAISGQSAAISATVNIIRLINSKQNPLYSLYNWVVTKLLIATNNQGDGQDPIISGLIVRSDALQLPSISFIALNNGLQCGLFYNDSGLQPNQICIHAINDVLEFKTSSKKDDLFWTVLIANQPRSLCLTLNKLPVVTIRFKDNTPSSIEWAKGIFMLEVVVVPAQLTPFEVDIVVTGDAGTAFYIVGGLNQGFGRRYVTIDPFNLGVADITIEPLANPDETVDKFVNVAIAQSSVNSVYVIGTSDVTATITPKINQIPLVSLIFADGSSELSINRGEDFATCIVSIDAPVDQDLVVRIDFTGTIQYDQFGIDSGLAFSNFIDITILAGLIAKTFTITPIASGTIFGGGTIVASIGGGNYNVSAANSITINVVEPRTFVSVVTTNNLFQQISKARFVIKFALSKPYSTDVLIESNLTGSLNLADFTLTGGSLSGSLLSVLISSGETSTDIEIVPVNRRILVDEDLYIDIDPGLIPVDINIDPFRANTRIIAIPSPIRARVKYFSRIVENPVYESPNFIFTQPSSPLNPSVYLSNTMYANLDLTSTDLTSNSELTQTYEFNRDLTLVQGRYSVYLRDFIFGADLDAIAPGTITPSVYGDYLDFDILSLANVAIGLGFRYIYIGGKVFRSQIPPSFPTQSYATASCEISDTVINFDIVDQNVSNRFSTKYAPLAGEVVSARIGYVDLGSLGLINIPRDGFPDSLITATGWALRADTADMSVSFVAPVIQADVPSRPDIFVSDRYPQPVSQ